MLLLSIHSLIAPRSAHAYVDPVSGSMIFQILAAGVIGAAFAAKHWWQGFVSWMRALISRLGRG
jgi:hypothetical protein